MYSSWRESEERRYRSGWEQTRVLCISFLQPWTRQKLSARDVLPLPWDATNGDGDSDGEELSEDLSEEERKARYEAAKKRYGIE